VARVDVAAVDVAIVDVACIDVAAVNAAHVDEADVDIARVDVDMALSTWLSLMWGPPTWPLGFDVAGRRRSHRPTPSFASTHLHLLGPPTPQTISSSSSSSCVLSSLGYVADVDMAGLTCPGRNRRGVADDNGTGAWRVST